MKKNEETTTSIVTTIVSLVITIIAILIRTHVIIIPEANPNGDRSLFDLFKNWLNFQTLAGWASIIGLLSTLFFGFYTIYLTKKSKEGENKTGGGPFSQGEKYITITSISHSNKDIMVVNLEYNGSSSWATGLNVNITKDDICSLLNSTLFPRDVQRDGSFVVKLQRNGLSYNKTKFSISWNDLRGDHEEVKEIDFEKGIEIIHRKKMSIPELWRHCIGYLRHR